MRRNDLISKAEVLETYAELYDIFDDNAAIREELHKVYAKINSLKELEAAQQWISVKDRLPEEDVDVLAYNGNYQQIAAYTTNPTKYWYTISGSTISPTHWMPLPEPPKEGT